MKIVVLGNGFIASHLNYEIANYRLYPNEQNVLHFIDIYKPDIIINASGFCGKPNVDECAIKKIETYTANVTVPIMLARECERRSIRVIHLGSGCIFFGNSPNKSLGYEPGWKESDFANPKSFYSKTKYATDLVIGELKNTTILRLRMPISSKNNPRNLLNKIINYKQVLEEPNSVTFIEDLVSAINFVIENNKIGIYHITSSKPLTHGKLLDEYKKHVPEHIYEKISKEKLSGLTSEPRSNCILDNTKIIKDGFKFTDTDLQIEKTIREFVENLRK